MLVCARLGDIVADGVSLAGVSDTVRTALALRHHRELTVHGRAGQRPAVHLPLLRGRGQGKERFRQLGQRRKIGYANVL